MAPRWQSLLQPGGTQKSPPAHQKMKQQQPYKCTSPSGTKTRSELQAIAFHPGFFTVYIGNMPFNVLCIV